MWEGHIVLSVSSLVVSVPINVDVSLTSQDITSYTRWSSANIAWILLEQSDKAIVNPNDMMLNVLSSQVLHCLLS